MKPAHYRATLGAICLCCIAACQSPGGGYGGFGNYGAVPASTAAGANMISGYGIVQAIDTVPRESAPVGVGTVGGALVGGLLGNQVGQGRGNTAATIAGAAGGAYVGRQVEKNMQQGQQAYRLTVRMDNGALQSFVQETPPAVRIGDRVRITNGMIQSY